MLPGLENVPSGQVSQPLPSTFNIWPPGHLSQVTDPLTVLKEPVAQSSQEVDWAAPEYFPMAHRTQVEAPLGSLE